MKRASVLIDLVLIEVLSIVLASYYFRGATSPVDGVMHLSQIKILLDNFKAYGYFPRWNPYWYFGVPMMRLYPPLSYYVIAFTSWLLNLSQMGDISMMWTYLVFSFISVSTYLLAREMGLKRLGCFVSSVLLLSSYNLIEYWGIGSYPNVTSVAFSPLALLFFYRAVKKRDLLNTLAAGLGFSAIILTYFMNAIILSVFIGVLSILIMIREPSLLYVSSGPSTPPKYTFIPPKILFSMILIAVGLSLWWTLPFLITYFTAPTIPEFSVAPKPLQDQLIALLGVYPNIDSPGVGQFILAVIACVVVFVKRKVKFMDAPLCFIVAFIFCLTPWLGIPVGPLFWWRFTLYLSLFASICGGITVDFIKDSYSRFLEQNSSRSLKERHSNKFYSFSLVALILMVSIYPVAGSESIVFSGFDISLVPEYIRFLEYRARKGERVGVDGGYDFNLYTDIPQSGGGNIHYVYMVNEFAYVFWRYMFVERDGRYLRYFARSYNVRWLTGPEMPGLTGTEPAMPHEVVGFNSRLIEVIGSESKLVLFIGDELEYHRFFLSIALSGGEDVIPIYGGNALDEFDAVTLRNFDAVYLAGLRRKVTSDLSQLLSSYVEGGGCVILDTGNVGHENEIGELPSPFPVKAIATAGSYLSLNTIISHNVTRNVDFTKFGTDKPYRITYAAPASIRDDSSTLVYDEGRPVLVYREQGFGRVFWIGLRLPYLIMLNEDDEVKSKEETKLLINIIRQAKSAETKPSKSTVHFEQTHLEEIMVDVRNASSRDALWVKMSYYPGWTAQIEDETHTQLRVFKAGPNMMLVFPQRSGDYTVKFYFDKTIDVKLGEYASLLSIIALPIVALLKTAKKKKYKMNKSNTEAKRPPLTISICFSFCP